MGKADKLVVDEIDGEWRIVWWLDDDDHGAILGEILYTQEDLDREPDQETRDHIAASLAVQALGPERGTAYRSFFWEQRSDAVKALAVAKAAIKADRLLGKEEHRGWPSWALTALANGWTPPKKWKP